MPQRPPLWIQISTESTSKAVVSLWCCAARSRAFSILPGCPLFHYRNRALHTKIKWWAKHFFRPYNKCGVHVHACLCVCERERVREVEISKEEWEQIKKKRWRMLKREEKEREVVLLFCFHVGSKDMGYDIKWHTASSAYFVFLLHISLAKSIL